LLGTGEVIEMMNVWTAGIMILDAVALKVRGGNQRPQKNRGGAGSRRWGVLKANFCAEIGMLARFVSQNRKC